MKNNSELQTIWNVDTVTLAQAMQTYGGSFLAKLSEALISADSSNRGKILLNWQEEISNIWNLWQSRNQ